MTDKPNIANIKMGSNSVITCYRVTVLPLYTISDGHLSMYQVSFDSLLYFQRYVPDKFYIAKIRKGNNSINTDDRVMVLAFCTSPCSPLSLYQVSFIYLHYFLRYALDKLTIAKIRKGNNSVITCDRVIRVRTRISFSFATIFANLIFFVPFSLTLSQILSQILAIFRQRIILSEKRCSFTDSFNCSNRFKSQYNVKCVGGLEINSCTDF